MTTVPQSAIDNWGKDRESPLELEVTVVPTSESEVEICSNERKVRIKSSVPLTEIVEHVQDLWGMVTQDTEQRLTVGFAQQHLETRVHPDFTSEDELRSL